MELLQVLWEASLEPNKLFFSLYKLVFFLYIIEMAHIIIFIKCLAEVLVN